MASEGTQPSLSNAAPFRASAVLPEGSTAATKGIGKFCALFAVLSLMWVAICISDLPSSMDFLNFVAGDPGSALSLDRLTSEGRTPGVDFGYYYGLSSAAFGRVWFALLGRGPWSLFALTALGGLAAAFGYALLATSLRLAYPQIILVVVGLASCFYPGRSCIPIYVLESLPMIFALAAQARRNLKMAMAFATVAALMKPTLAYVYLLILFVLWAGECRRNFGLKIFLVGLAPSAAIAAIVLGGLVSLFGLEPVANSLFPSAGARNYRLYDFGFFRAGKAFWAGPPGATRGYFLGTPAAARTIGTVGLFLAGMALLPTVLRGKADRRAEFAVTCAVLHAVFIAFAFAHSFSWGYYYYVLIFGLAAAWAAVSEFAFWWTSICGWILVVLFATANYSSINAAKMRWTTMKFDRDLDLFADPNAADEWMRIREIAKREPVFVIGLLGGAHEIEPLVLSPKSWLLCHFQAPPWERDRALEDLRSARVLVVPKYLRYDESPWHPINGPVFAEAVGAFDQFEKGTWFTIRRRLNLQK